MVDDQYGRWAEGSISVKYVSLAMSISQSSQFLYAFIVPCTVLILFNESAVHCKMFMGFYDPIVINRLTNII